jgi:hypothetical protein
MPADTVELAPAGDRVCVRLRSGGVACGSFGGTMIDMLLGPTLGIIRGSYLGAVSSIGTAGAHDRG